MPTAILHSHEIQHYLEKGYVIPRFSLPPEMVKDLQTTLEALIHANPDVRPEKLVSAHIEGQQKGKNDDGVAGSRQFLALPCTRHWWTWSHKSLDPMWRCGAVRCFVNPLNTALKHRGTKMVNTGPCAL